jgi:DNA polymerase-3 subunit delta'
VESKLCDLREKLEMFKKHLNVTDENCFIEINGNNSTIKKEEIFDIIQRFQLSSFHGSPKLYVIKGIENSSAQAINALLKFLEEPPINTYAILTTKNINVVLQTIKSRCQIVILKSNFKKLDELINKFNLTDEQINVIKNVYYD